MKALIDPRENRICQVQETEFAIAEPLFWVDCPDHVVPDVYVWDGNNIIPPKKIKNDYAIEEWAAKIDLYPEADAARVSSILNSDWPGLQVQPRLNSKNILVGVEAVRAYSTDWSSSGASFLSTRSLLNECKRQGVPVVAFLMPTSGVTLEELTKFWTDCGTTCINGNDRNYVYTEWSDEYVVNRKLRDIDAERDAAIERGFDWDGHRWDCTKATQSNLTSVVAGLSAGVDLPNDFVWRSKANVNVPMEADAVKNLFAAMNAHINSYYKAAWQAKEVVLNGE